MFTSMRSVQRLLRRELLEVDRGGDPDRERQQQGHEQGQNDPVTAPQMPACSGSRESPA
jgi:hypothetical protein